MAALPAIRPTSVSKRASISLGKLDEVVEKPDSIREFLEDNPKYSVNQVFNVTPHSVQGMDWTSTLLQRACSQHRVDAVAYLLARGADPNLFRDAVEDINSIPPITLCVLHAITPEKRARALTSMRALVAHGAAINRETECSSYPLECAAAIAKDRSRRSMWELALFLVEYGALTRHLTPNLFSAPPEELVEQLRAIEKERNETISSLLTFTLQCTNIKRTRKSQPKTAENSISISITTPTSSSPKGSFFTPKCSPRSPFHTPTPSRSSSHSMGGPLSQLGLMSPTCTPPTACTTPRSAPLTPHITPITPTSTHNTTTPRATTLSITIPSPSSSASGACAASNTHTLSAFTTPTNLARRRTFAAAPPPPPRAPFSKLKASGLKRSNFSSRSIHTNTAQTPSETLQFVTPTSGRTASKRSLFSANTSSKRRFSQVSSGDCSSFAGSPFQTPKLKRRRLTRGASGTRISTTPTAVAVTTVTTTPTPQTSTEKTPDTSSSQREVEKSLGLGGGVIPVPTDVQRTILEFAMPVLHTATRKRRINAMLAMKAKRSSGASLSTWFSFQEK